MKLQDIKNSALKISRDGQAVIVGDEDNCLIVYPNKCVARINGREFEIQDQSDSDEAQWIQTNDTDEWVCSNCGHFECCNDFYPDELELNYCSRCGKKMSVNRIDFNDECLYEEAEDDECTENE